MAVNGIEIEVGQVWRRRDGHSVSVESRDAHQEWPWNLKASSWASGDEWSVGCDGRVYPEGAESVGDLVELISPAPTKELPVQFAEPESANATQVGGTHYKAKAIQPWDYIASNEMGFLAGNVIKYVTRYRDKNGIEDLKKARHYLDKLIETEGGAQ